MMQHPSRILHKRTSTRTRAIGVWAGMLALLACGTSEAVATANDPDDMASHSKAGPKAGTRSYALRDFDSISIGGAIEAEIAVGGPYAVRIDAPESQLDRIEVEVNGSELVVAGKSRNGHGRIVAVVTLPALRQLDISGASQAAVAGIDAAALEVDLSGASRAKLGGSAKKLDIAASGASQISASALKAKDVNAEASGASQIEVHVAGALHAEASGASQIRYTGSPTSVERRVSGASIVQAMK